MFDPILFADKLRRHRKMLGLTQEEVADRIGVSAQAVSKWETGECLPDVYNLEALCRLYALSLDILLNTEPESNVQDLADHIEQMTTEFIWSRYGHLPDAREQPTIHHDLGEDLLTLWKGIYFVETGNRELQKRDKEQGNLRVISPFGLKVWDDDGVVAVVKSELWDRLENIGEREYTLLQALASPEGMAILALCRPNQPVSKEELLEKSGVPIAHLNELLFLLCEGLILTYDVTGYRLCGHMGIAAYMVMAAGYLLSKKRYTVSEFTPCP